MVLSMRTCNKRKLEQQESSHFKKNLKRKWAPLKFQKKIQIYYLP